MLKTVARGRLTAEKYIMKSAPRWKSPWRQQFTRLLTPGMTPVTLFTPRLAVPWCSVLKFVTVLFVPVWRTHEPLRTRPSFSRPFFPDRSLHRMLPRSQCAQTKVPGERRPLFRTEQIPGSCHPVFECRPDRLPFRAGPLPAWANLSKAGR